MQIHHISILFPLDELGKKTQKKQPEDWLWFYGLGLWCLIRQDICIFDGSLKHRSFVFFNCRLQMEQTNDTTRRFWIPKPFEITYWLTVFYVNVCFRGAYTEHRGTEGLKQEWFTKYFSFWAQTQPSQQFIASAPRTGRASPHSHKRSTGSSADFPHSQRQGRSY